MVYRKFMPSLALRPYIECFYLWQQPTPTAPLLVRSPPTGYAALVFNLGETYETGLETVHWDRTPRVFLTGQATQGYHLRVTNSLDIVGVVFRPTGLYHLLRQPMRGLTDRRVDASLVMGPRIMELWKQLGECPDVAHRMALLDQVLQQQLLTLPLAWDAVDGIVDEIISCHGLASMQHLLADCALSPRQFQRKFQAKVGVSAKFYCKLRRFGHICQYLIRQEVIDWQEVVWMGGYYDQSHFIKDFLAFMKENPTAYYHSPQEVANLLET